LIDKETITFIAISLGIIAYIPYLISIFKRETKPHLLTWIIWGVLTAIAFAGQITYNGGIG